MPIKHPTDKEICEIAKSYNLKLTTKTLASFQTLMKGAWRAIDYVAEAKLPKPEIAYPRKNIHQPSAQDNPYNAWFYRADIKGKTTGKLAGKTFAIKDNTCVADVPLMCGAKSLLDVNYKPAADATVITRILDAGGEIKGKAHCECFCLSGSSFTNALGATLNPHKTTHSAGGSSAGSAVLVACGEVDMAMACDQGGSIRIPSSWCGAYGMKPTYGLVPYTGIMSMERTLDHTGPISKTVMDNALCLEAIAGYDDGLDPRQHPSIKVDNYTAYLGKDIKGIKIGILKEAFATNVSETIVDDTVKEAAKHLQSLGAIISEVEYSKHLYASTLWDVIALEGIYDMMLNGNAYATNAKGDYALDMIEAQSHWPDYVNELSETFKLNLLTASYVKSKCPNIHYAQARQLASEAKKSYDALLNKVDLLLMPTTPMRATELPSETISHTDYIKKTGGMGANTAPFNLTGHPAMSIPCGIADGLPIGMQLVGDYYCEGLIYQVADAFEKLQIFP